ncbi:DnaJ C-terminal domain-containing protein [Fannyhessea vaginae]|uniref:DnaJ C-terminal domain-containing protein n=1 Tax=Fannyhessea vaginae TaxID=82135 RepID=UPI00288C49A8|nr:DnaJ C-terminal domain-containing protein [Fannyhessea vaginae]
MAQRSYYDILGVPKSATDQDIRRAFRKLAAKYHPDAGGDEKKFKEISEAYTTLSDKNKRREYDQMLQFGGIGGSGFGSYASGGRGSSYAYTANMGNWNDVFTNIRNGNGAFSDFDFSSIFGNAAGSSGYTQRSAKGRDLTLSLTLSAQQAYNGCTQRVRFTIPSTKESQTLEVKVPAGAQNGGKLRYRGRGEYGIGTGERGDLVITTSVSDDPLFHRDGADVHMELPISIYEAILGAHIDIPTPDGTELRLKIPAGTQDGKTFRFKDLGACVPKKKGARGSLFVSVRVKIPTYLSAKERETFERLRDNDMQDYRKDVREHGDAWKKR